MFFYANDDQRLGDSDRRDQTFLNQIEKKEYVLLLHQHHLLVGNFHFPLIKEANRLFATPMLPAMIIPRPRKEVNPFRGAFLLRFSPGITPLPGESTRCGSPRRRRRAGGLPTVGARVPLRPLFVPAVRSLACRQEATGRAYSSIRLRGLARAILLS